MELNDYNIPLNNTINSLQQKSTATVQIVEGLKLEAHFSLSENPYKRIMKLPKKITRVFGLSHKKNEKFSKVYSLLILLLMWLNILRILSSFDVFFIKKFILNLSFRVKICNFLVNIIIAFQATVLFFNQEKLNREESLITHLNHLFKYIDRIKVGTNTRMLKRKINLIFLVALFSGLVHSLLICISVIYGSFSIAMTLPFNLQPQNNFSTVYKILIIVLETYASVYLCLSIAFYSSHCIILMSLFDTFDKQFKLFIKNSIIRPHERNSNTVNATDSRLKGVYANVTKKIETEDKFEYYR